MSSSLDEFNRLAADQARGLLRQCLTVTRWVDDVVAARPYVDRPALLERADSAASDLTDEELDEALGGHPRIGEQAGAGHAVAFSEREQSGVSDRDEGAAAALAAGNLAYEQRFGRVFLVRAAGRDAGDILTELNRRLGNDDQKERAEVVRNLRDIALLRLEELVG